MFSPELIVEVTCGGREQSVDFAPHLGADLVDQLGLLGADPRGLSSSCAAWNSAVDAFLLASFTMMKTSESVTAIISSLKPFTPSLQSVVQEG
jgi:hypothetical protein